MQRMTKRETEPLLGSCQEERREDSVSCFFKPSRRLPNTSGLNMYFPKKQMNHGTFRRGRPLVFIMARSLLRHRGDFFSKLSPALSKAGRKAAPGALCP